MTDGCICVHSLEQRPVIPQNYARGVMAGCAGDTAAGPTANAAALVPAANALPVRIGVAVIGTVVIFGLIMVARSTNRRPQH